MSRKNLDRLLSGFVKDEYSEKKLCGFSHVAGQGNCIEGQYVERFESVTKVEDPFGKVLEYPFMTYEKTVFKIGTQFPNLELRDSPRSLAVFFSQIARLLDFKITIAPIEVNLLDWIGELEKELDSLEVTAASIGNISLSNSVAARIALSGTTDVRPLAKSLVGRRSFAFNRLQIRAIFNSEPFKCELAADARVSLTAGVQAPVVELLRETLVAAVAKQEQQGGDPIQTY